MKFLSTLGFRMRKDFKFIAGGLTFIALVAVCIFFCLFRYMDSETVRRVKDVAQVHLHGMSNQEMNRYEAIKSLRFRQMGMKIETLHEKGVLSDAEKVKKELLELAHLSACQAALLLPRTARSKPSTEKASPGWAIPAS